MADNNKPHCSSQNESTEETEEAVSMLDVLEEEKQLEEDANAVLGDSDENNCTYLMGYVPRQALYACITCISQDTDLAGVCLACSLQCHENHDLVELYTKRNFKCDCGNEKFGGKQCKLSKDKAALNGENKYNHNFQGTYCICNRPYPDPEDEIEDEMIQCIVCEDWLHGRHLGTEVPDDYDEMICAPCMSKCDFLWAYTVLSTETSKLDNENTNESVDVDLKPSTSKQTSPKRSPSHKGHGEGASSTKSPVVKCQLKDLQQREVTHHDGATFWPEQWRNKLCPCKTCKNLYENLNVSFLAEEGDSIRSYEERGRQRTGSQYERGLQALSGMDRTQQVEMLHGYNDMKSQLSDYLKKFADNKKVVREEDIKEFFQSLSANKRQRTSSAPQNFCR